MLDWLADGVSGLAAFLGGSATGVVLSTLLTYPLDCTVSSGGNFGSPPTQTCQTVFQAAPWDKGAAAIFALIVGVLAGIAAAGLRQAAETYRDRDRSALP